MQERLEIRENKDPQGCKEEEEKLEKEVNLAHREPKDPEETLDQLDCLESREKREEW